MENTLYTSISFHVAIPVKTSTWLILKGHDIIWTANPLFWRLWAKSEKKIHRTRTGTCRQDVQLTALKNTLYTAISIHVAIPLKTSTLVNFEVAKHVLSGLSTIRETLTLSWAKKLEENKIPWQGLKLGTHQDLIY